MYYLGLTIVIAMVVEACGGCGDQRLPPAMPDAAVPSCADVACVPGRIACGYLTDAGVFEHPELCTCEVGDGSVVACHN